MPIPSAVKEWKYRWDLVMNDKTFRIARTGTADYTCNYRTGFGNNKISGTSGTIYIKDPAIGDQGHFIGYRRNANKIVLFDPAPPEGTFGAWANQTVINYIKANTGMPVSIEKYHTQHHKEDTFCATWSLAWLDPNMKNFTTKVTNGTSGIKNSFHICQKIASKADFPQDVVRVFKKEGMTELQARNFLKRTNEWLNMPITKNNPFWKIFED
jgi:hypothetical protein